MPGPRPCHCRPFSGYPAQKAGVRTLALPLPFLLLQYSYFPASSTASTAFST